MTTPAKFFSSVGGVSVIHAVHISQSIGKLSYFITISPHVISRMHKYNPKIMERKFII